MISLSEYFEKLAVKHLGHDAERDCHFSDATVFSSRVPRLMHYPCMGIDAEGFQITGQNGNEFIAVQYNMYVLNHIRDTGSLDELNKAFGTAYTIAMKVLKDIKGDNTKPGCYLDFQSVAGTRIEFKDAALYGYAIGMTFLLPFDFFTCQL